MARSVDPAPERNGLLLSGLQGSALEHAVFEDLFLVDAISADKGLGIARQEGVAIESVDAANASTVVPTLSVSPAVRDAVAQWAGRGMRVEIPRTEVSRNAWRGAVFRVDDPVSGASGYFLSGGLAGGSTTEEPESWLLQFLAAALAAPHDEPNLDPLAGATIQKVETTDRQRGEVAQLLPLPLAVLVHDSVGRPVVAARVTFVSYSGGGRFLDESDVAVERLSVTTNPQGIASARLRLGTSTAVDPVYELKSPGDTYPSRLGAHLVEVTVATHDGDLALAAPFTALAYPGEPSTLVRTDRPIGQIVPVDSLAIWVDTMAIQPQDQFGNPVSNVPIDARITMTGPADPTCTNDPPVVGAAPAAVFDREECDVPYPLLGQCGGETVTAWSTAKGVRLGVISGNQLQAFFVEARSGGVPPARQDYSLIYTQPTGTGACRPLRSAVRVASSWLSDQLGHNIQAARPSSWYGPMRFELLVFDPFGGSICNYCAFNVLEYQEDPSRCPDPVAHPPQPMAPNGGVWVRLPDDRLESLTLSVTNGGSATSPLRLDEGLFETTLTTGAVVGENFVEADIVTHAGCCPSWNCSQTPLPTASRQNVTSVWTVWPIVSGVVPYPIPLDDQGQTSEPAEIHYAISPPVYFAASAEVDFVVHDEEVATGTGSSRQAGGVSTVQRGLEIDPGLEYSAQLVLNRGTAAEVRSDLVPLPFAQQLFAEVDGQVTLSQDVDLVNHRVCLQPDAFHFLLTREATVRLDLFGLMATPDGGYADDGSHVALLPEGVMSAGPHDVEVLPGDVPPGRYRFVLHG